MSSTPDGLPELLARLTPTRELGRDYLQRLASKARVSDLRPGHKLHARDEHHWLGYVISGKVNLVSSGKPAVIDAASERAGQPVFRPDSLRDYAVALTPGKWLRVDRQLFETLCRDETDSGLQVEDLNLSDTEATILASLYQACLSGTLELPSMPEVAMQIRDASRDPDVDLASLARIVQMDLAVTGGLIKAANSAMYGGHAPTGNVRGAIQRLGLETTRKLVMSIAMGRVFTSDNPAIKGRMHELWDHSVQVSALSFVIARHCGRLDPEVALLAGLLHDVGVIPIVDYVGIHAPELDAQEREDIIVRLHALTGELVINHWGLGPQISQAVREADLWYRDDAKGPDYTDVIQVAQLYAFARQGRDDRPRFDSVPAFERLRLSEVTAEGRIDPVHEAEEEINMVMDMLKSRKDC